MKRLKRPYLTLNDVLRARASADPDRVAIVFGEDSLTFGQLELDSNRLANGLRAIGLASGERLGLFMPNCPEFEIAFYGASKLGAVASPLNSSYREREVTYQLNDAGASVLLTHAKLWPIVSAVRRQLKHVRRIVVVGGEQADLSSDAVSYTEVVEGQSTDPPPVRIDPEQIVALPYSSGTTGRPKGVMLTHRNLLCNHEQYVLATRMGADDSYIVYMPLSHIYGVALIGVAVWSGAKQIILERFDLEKVVRLIQEHGVTWLFVVPPVLLTLANAPGLDPSQFRTVKFAFSAAAPLAPEVARRVEARLALTVIQGYGLTEASPATHYSPLESELIKLESCGVLMAETEHRIVDIETGDSILPAGDIGEIVVRGPQVMKGYWHAPEDTAQVLRDGWLYTGDIGCVDNEGYVYISDRKKEMIKYKSFSIAPAELEAVLLEHPDVADCAVVGVRDDEAGESPKAFVVSREGRTLDLDILGRFVSERVAGYKRIRHFEIVNSIPRTPSGKILRRKLKERALSGHGL
jgi:long-chain acyl-CoA synthetase